MAKISEVFEHPANNLGITLHHNTPHDVAVVWEVAKTALNCGRKVAILNLTALTPRGRTFFPEDQIRHLAESRKSSPISRLESKCSVLGISFLTPKRNLRDQVQDEIQEVFEKFPNTLDGLIDWPAYGGYLGPSIASYLTSLVHPSESIDVTKHLKYAHQAVANFLTSRTFIANVIDSRELDELSVFNGRFPSMAGAVFEANQRQIRTLWHEIGRTREFLFLEPFAPHNRVLMQDAMLEFSREFSSSQLERIMQEFVFHRRLNVASNPFLRYQSVVKSDNVTQTGRRAVVFTSSPDETIGIGNIWRDVEWKDQYEAISAAVSKLNDLGYQVTIRLHPNLITKSWDELILAMHYFRDLNCEVILPTDNINSYDLLDQASIVIVWRSTLGLEAIARGIPTFALGRNRYDRTADMKMIHSRQDLLNETFQSFRVNPNSVVPGVLWQKYAARRNTSQDYLHFIEESQSWLRYQKTIGQVTKVFLPFHLRSKFASSPNYLYRVASYFLSPKKTAAIFRAFLRFYTIFLAKEDHQ
jgi:hypothetical protein